MAAGPRTRSSYMLAGAEKEPAGVWGGEGLSMVGAQAGAAATEAEVRAVFGRLEHPTRIDLRTGEAVPLGSRPRNFDSRDERVAQALAAEPDATEERKAEIRQKAQGKRKPVAYYDLTFSPVKSGSVYWAGLLETGRDAEAANVVEAHRAAVAAAMAYVEEQVAYVRSGYHGKTASGQSVGVYEEARGLVWIRWDHSTSRAQQPQLHSHVTVLNRAETNSDGVIRALASRGFKPIKQAADAIYTKVFEERLVASNGVAFATREDGKAREIVGFSTQLLAKASSRNADVTARREELIQQFEQAHGRAPSPVEHKQMDVAAWRETRQAKNYAVAPRQQVSNWAEPVREQLTAEVAAADAAGERLARDGHPEQQGYETRDREQVLRAALRTVQRRYATWDVGNLAMAIRDEQVCTPAVAGSPPDLAAEVLRRGRPVRGRGAVGPRRRHRAARAAPPGRAQPLPDAQRRGVRHHRSAGDRSGHRRARPRHRRCRAVRAGAGAGLGGAAGRRARRRPARQSAADPVVRALRRHPDRCGRGGEVPHGRGAGPRVGAADRRPGHRCGDLEHRCPRARRRRAQRDQHPPVPAPVRPRRARARA